MKNLFVKILLSLLTVGFLCSFSTSAVSVDGVGGFQAFGLDTVAGVSTYLKSSHVTPGQEVVFTVLKPDGTTVNVSAVANSNGVAKVELSDYYTRSAGIYEVSAGGNRSSFEVFPGDTSSLKSTVSPSEQVTGVNKSANVTVTLLDDYENPIEGHVVKLISSSDNEIVEVASGLPLTNSQGQIDFRILSSSTGASTYTAYDSTADIVMADRAKVVYFDSSTSLFGDTAPNDYLFAASGASSGNVDHFVFEDLPSTITVSESVTFTLTAEDSADQTVLDYDGAVRFAVTSDNAFNAILPSDYTFVAEDLGSHVFSLALAFSQPGEYTVEVRDLDNPSIFGEQAFRVTASDLTSTTLSSSSIVITNPVAGTYSNNIQVISGSVLPGAKVKVFDNEVEVGTVTADVSGIFSFTSSPLADGVHSFYIATVNDVGTIIETSDPVAVTIDTASAELMEVQLDPGDHVGPGDIVGVRVFASDPLNSAAVVVNSAIYELLDTGLGYYEGSFSAPIEFGDYSMSYVLVDQLGNESQFAEANTLTVGPGGAVAGPSLVENVTNLVAESADRRVILTWSAPEVSTNPIAHYRVFYGLSPNQLTEAVDTFTNSTTWYIPNLSNGTEIFFAVAAVDNLGNTSELLSNIVSSVPNPVVTDVVPPDVVAGIAGADAIDDMEKDPTEAGPDVLWLVVLSIFGGVFYILSSKRRLLLRD